MKTKFFSRALLIVGLAVLVCGFSMQASAMTFTFTENAGFEVGNNPGDIVPTSTDVATPTNDIKWYNVTPVAPVVLPVSGEFNTLAWGVSNDAGAVLGATPWGNPNYSAIGVFGHSGTVDADNGWVTISQLFHQNSSILQQWFTLQTAMINGVLTIAPADPGSFPNTDDNIVTFNETLNLGGNPIPDTFTIDASTFNAVPFTWNGNQYAAEFQIIGIGATAIAYNADGTVTITTQEEALNEAQVQMRIRTTPEPASLALLGLGLLGLGFIKRRRKNS